MKLPGTAKLERVEWFAAILLTAALVGLHLAVLFSAGPLWRDEISSLTLATKPTWSEVWATLVYDPFPALFFTTLRVWHGLFGGSDFVLRVLGCLIGVAALGSFWLSARLTNRRTPIIALLLFGFSPTLIIWGDSLRAYGLAVLTITIAFACFWRVVNRPRPMEVGFATLAAVLSAQSIFTNAPLIFACGVAAALVAVRRREWKRAMLVLLIGAVAAVSLLPYVGVMRATQDWAEIRKFPLPVSADVSVLLGALRNGGTTAVWLWIALIAVSIGTAVVVQFRTAFTRGVCELRDPLLYALVAGTMGFACTLIFFHAVAWPTNIWYYLPVLAVVALAVDSALDLKSFARVSTIARTLLAIVFFAWSFPVVLQRVEVRASNVDLIAAALQAHAAPDDLIVIYPFADGITFQRYFHGQTPWLTIPNVADLSLHRWDQLMEQARTKDALAPALQRVNETLQAGHKVWVASTFPLTARPGPPRAVLPLRQEEPRRIGYFLGGWRDQFVTDLRAHAAHLYTMDVPADQSISMYERSRLVVFAGWNDSLVKAH